MPPGATLSHMPPGCCSAIAATSVRLGSMTMSSVPFLAASFTLRPIMGWASVVFEPQISRQSVPIICSKGVVAAPLPSVASRPLTDGACQTRAQLSTLLVPQAARASF